MPNNWSVIKNLIFVEKQKDSQIYNHNKTIITTVYFFGLSWTNLVIILQKICNKNMLNITTLEIRIHSIFIIIG